MRSVNVAVPSNIVAGFRYRAKRIFPLEVFGLLLGSHRKSQYIIEDIHYPIDWHEQAREDRVCIRQGWWVEAAIAAGWQDLGVIGDMHSHCYEDVKVVKDCALSQQDCGRFEVGYLQGVMVVTRCGDGKLRSRFRFWAPCPQTTPTVLR